jgi:uncharacterized membrane protein
MEEIAKQITITVSHAVEILAAIIIGIAVIKIAIEYILMLRPNRFANKSLLRSRQGWMGRPEKRVQFGSSVAVALELMLGADVLATAVAPSWNDIGQLAAIAVIRTALNYFLGKELKELHPATER